MTLKFGSVSSSVDLSTEGKRAGTFDLTHSNNRYAFSSIQSPLSVIVGGRGPTALICAGNHGDEYEGQIIVRRLYEQLEPSDMAGRLILAPALNMPAILGRARVSPLDGGNLNRSFPGQANAGPTQEIAGFVSSRLMPLANLAIDIHSGGSATDYLDCSYFCISSDRARNQQTQELASIMGLANTFVVPLSDTSGDFDTSALEAGCHMLSCELGGEGKVSRRALETGWQGVLRVLAHHGVITKSAASRLCIQPPANTRFLDLGESACVITAPTYGLMEPLVGMGTYVAQGQPVALLRELHRLDTVPKKIMALSSGVVAIRRVNPIVEPGDHLVILCSELDKAKLAVRLREEESKVSTR